MYNFELMNAICYTLWSLAYICLIYRAFKDKTCGVPLVVLGFLFAWETTYPYVHKVYNTNPVIFKFYIAWLLFDATLILAYFLFNFKLYKKYFGANRTAWAYFSSFTLAVPIILMLWGAPWLAKNIDTIGQGPNSLAHIAVAICSVGFVFMHFTRDTVDGQSFTIAWAKMIGSAVNSGSTSLLLHGADNWGIIKVCILTILIFDIWYTVLIYRRLRQLRINPWIRV